MQDNEIADYLRGLLDHEAGCESVPCPTCAALRRIVELIQGRLFGSVVYEHEDSPGRALPAVVQAARHWSPRRRRHSVR